MTHNDILRRVRYILDARDNKIAAIFAHSDHQVSTDQVNNWLKSDDDPDYVELSSAELILFLDGLIIDLRGHKKDPKTATKDGPKITYKQTMSNNLILMKLKIAFHLKSEDVLEIMQLAQFKISPHELSALFRKKDHKHYRVCKNQMLRKFMKGLQLKYRGKHIPKAVQNSETNSDAAQDSVVAKQPNATVAKPSETKTSKPKTSKPKTSKPKTSAPKTSAPKTSEPKTSEPKTSEPKSSKTKSSEPTQAQAPETQSAKPAEKQQSQGSKAKAVWKQTLDKHKDPK